MTDPAPVLPTSPQFTPKWLNPGDVAEWLRLNDQAADDAGLLRAVSAMAEPYVQRCRPEWWTPGEDGDRTFTPDAETYQGAVMYAAREYRRRNSPAGVETFGEAASFVARYDPDIERALQTGPYAPPLVG